MYEGVTDDHRNEFETLSTKFRDAKKALTSRFKGQRKYKYSAAPIKRRFAAPIPAIFTAFAIDECAWLEV